MMTKIANENYDGHYTILKFTDSYKVAFGTPSDLRDDVPAIPTYPDLESALKSAVKDPQNHSFWESFDPE